MDLKKQSINGAVWTFIDILINKGAYFIATIILAGLLGPKDFGLIGMIMLFVNMGNSLADSGMSTSLLRSKDVTEKDFATVFVTNLIMSLLIYLLVFFLAPSISKFYEQPILIAIIRWYCLGFIISSFRSIQNVKLMREMKFKKLTILNLPGNISSVIISIIMGYQGFGVWSLVALFLVNQTITTIMTWLFIKWKPKLDFDFDNYKYHFNFGYKLVLSAQLNTIFENIYNIIIGKFYNTTLLGYYERAYTFNNYPVSILSGIILKVTLPSLTMVKDDLKRLQEAYKNIMQIAFLISTLGLGLAALIAKPIFLLILGKEWMPMVPMFQVLTLSYIFYPIHSLNINILSVFGRSDLFLKLEIVKKITIAIVVAACFSFGIMGLIWSSVITSFLCLIINTYYSGKFLNYRTKNQLIDLLPTTFCVLLSIAVSYFFNMFYAPKNLILNIILNFLTSIFTFVLISEKFNLAPYKFMKLLILTQIKK